MTIEDRAQCLAVHPELGLQCKRLAKHCVGPEINHTAKREDGAHVLWPNERGSTPMHQLFDELRRSVCPTCSAPLDLQFRSPLLYWCAICRKWFNERLERM